MSKGTNEDTDPELRIQAKEVINKRAASSAIIELMVEALSYYVLAGDLPSHSATSPKTMPGVPWWWLDFLDLPESMCGIVRPRAKSGSIYMLHSCQECRQIGCTKKSPNMTSSFKNLVVLR